jgi:predicted RNase H-like HicB family nuclease
VTEEEDLVAARAYIALLRKEKGSDYGVEFPDLPGCVTAGRTLDEARRAAQEALELHLEGMREEGLEVPPPSSLEGVLAGEIDTRGAVPFLVGAPVSGPRVVRVNVTFKPSVLERLDRFAEAQHLTRAAALERAIRDSMPSAEKRPVVKVVRRRGRGARRKKAARR